MSEVQFTIEAEPVPAQRPRVTQRGVSYYPRKHTAYAEGLKAYLSAAPALLADGPVELRLKFVMPRYKTSDHPVHRADIDNLSKLPMDCMTKAVEGTQKRFWEDDCMVVSLTTFKRFARDGEQPHTQVIARTINENVEDYVDRMFDQ